MLDIHLPKKAYTWIVQGQQLRIMALIKGMTTFPSFFLLKIPITPLPTCRPLPSLVPDRWQGLQLNTRHPQPSAAAATTIIKDYTITITTLG